MSKHISPTTPRYRICEHLRNKYNCSICLPASVYSEYKRRATTRGTSFELTLDQFRHLVTLNCSYCGRSPEDRRGMGVDRHDNTVGYTLGNSISCCQICNMMKSDWPLTEFLSTVSAIARHLKI